MEKPCFFSNERGQNLCGVLHMPVAADKAPLVVMAHGFTDDKTGDNRLFVRFARRAVGHGFAVFRFDFAGSGDSEGEFSRMTLESEREDLASAIDFSDELPGIDRTRINLIGYSLGGAIAAALAANNKRIISFIGWAPVFYPRLVFRRILGENAFETAKSAAGIPCRNGAKRFYLSKEFFDSVDKSVIVHSIGKIAPRPVAVIQGTGDVKVLPKETAALFRAANEPKTLHLIRGACHSFARYEEEVIALTLRHLREWNRDQQKRRLRSFTGTYRPRDKGLQPYRKG